MAVFYVLPPRTLLAEHLAQSLRPFLPGLRVPSQTWAAVAELLSASAAPAGEVFLVHREDLPMGEELSAALCHGFGAEPGDQVLEVRPGAKPGEPFYRVWRIEGRPAPIAAAG